MKRELVLNVDGEEITVTAVREGEAIHVERDGVAYTVRILAESVVGMQTASTTPTGSTSMTAPARTSAPGSSGRSTTRPAPASAAPSGGGAAGGTATGPGTITAPMTGVIDQVPVAVGSEVAEGAVVVVLEAMKMFIDVVAPTGGTVSSVSVHPGDSVKEGEPLLTIG
jgi:biotin carboxyl carrier protein